MATVPALVGMRTVHREEAAQRAKTRQTEKEAKEAEKERDKQRRKDKGGLLGNVGDTLSDR